MDSLDRPESERDSVLPDLAVWGGVCVIYGNPVAPLLNQVDNFSALFYRTSVHCGGACLFSGGPVARLPEGLGISSSGSSWWCRRFPGRGKGGRLRPRLRRRRRP